MKKTMLAVSLTLPLATAALAQTPADAPASEPTPAASTKVWIGRYAELGENCRALKIVDQSARPDAGDPEAP